MTSKGSVSPSEPSRTALCVLVGIDALFMGFSMFAYFVGDRTIASLAGGAAIVLGGDIARRLLSSQASAPKRRDDE